MQVVHGENDLVANDPLVEYPPFCVIYPAHDLIPFPGRDNVVPIQELSFSELPNQDVQL